MSENNIICPKCGEEVSNCADVCYECGEPVNGNEMRLSKSNVRAEAKERYIEGTNSYEVVDVEYELHGTELEITAFVQKTAEGKDCDGEGDRFWLTMLDPSDDEISSGPADLPYMEVGETSDVWIKALVDRMGTYSILVELQ